MTSEPTGVPAATAQAGAFELQVAATVVGHEIVLAIQVGRMSMMVTMPEDVAAQLAQAMPPILVDAVGKLRRAKSGLIIPGPGPLPPMPNGGHT